MKLRRSRLKRPLGWISTLAGTTMLCAVFVSHFESRFEPLVINALCYGDKGFEFSRSDIGEIRDDSFFMPHSNALGNWSVIQLAPGLAAMTVDSRGNGAIRFDYFTPLDSTPRTYLHSFVVAAAENAWLLHISLGTRAYGVQIHAVWFWALGLPMFALPITLRWRNRRRRQRKGACKKCRYDLAGLAMGSPCPECGAEGAR